MSLKTKKAFYQMPPVLLNVLLIEQPGWMAYLAGLLVMVIGVVLPLIYIVNKNRPQSQRVSLR